MKVRPDTNPIFIASKYPGSTALKSALLVRYWSSESPILPYEATEYCSPPASGNGVTPPTDSTPGMVARRSPSWLTNDARSCDVRYLINGMGTLKVATFLASNPGSTFWIAAKLRTMSPAPINRTSDSVTSLTTSTVRSLFPRAPPVSVPRSRRPSARLPRTARRSEEHTSELQSLAYLVCRLLLEKKKQLVK